MFKNGATLPIFRSPREDLISPTELPFFDLGDQTAIGAVSPFEFLRSLSPHRASVSQGFLFLPHLDRSLALRCNSIINGRSEAGFFLFFFLIPFPFFFFERVAPPPGGPELILSKTW